MNPPERVHIHYHRPPDRLDVFEQDLIFDGGEVKVTLARDIRRDGPLVISGETVLEPGSDVVWFTFPGRWHDIARFHRADGTFTGVYANVLVPCEFEPGQIWRTTDLFLDVWSPAAGASERGSGERGAGSADRDAAGSREWGDPLVLDEDELAEAVERGWISLELAHRARQEAATLVGDAVTGHWPPPPVRAWTRERALATLSPGA